MAWVQATVEPGAEVRRYRAGHIRPTW